MRSAPTAQTLPSGLERPISGAEGRRPSLPLPPTPASDTTPAPPPTSLTRDDIVALGKKAAKLLDAGQPHQALALLQPKAHEALAKTNVGFQNQLATAYGDVAEALVRANQLGAVAMTLEPGSWVSPTLRAHRIYSAFHAERLACYIGILGARGRICALLQQPDEQARFLEAYSAPILTAFRWKSQMLMHEAYTNYKAFLTTIHDATLLKNRTLDNDAGLAERKLKIFSPVVRHTDSTAKHPLYYRIGEATEQVFEEVRSTALDFETHLHVGMSPPLFWLNWHIEEEDKLGLSEELTLARPHLPFGAF